jgi:hypothetical protein
MPSILAGAAEPGQRVSALVLSGPKALVASSTAGGGRERHETDLCLFTFCAGLGRPRGAMPDIDGLPRSSRSVTGQRRAGPGQAGRRAGQVVGSSAAHAGRAGGPAAIRSAISRMRSGES